MKHTYHAYGLHIASDVALPLRPAWRTSAPDLLLTLGEDRPVPHARPPGAVLAEIARPDRTIFYTLVRGERTVLRYPGVCDFVGNAAFDRITAHPHPTADKGLLPVLIAGALMAMHLALRNALVLHASAVSVEGSAVAFVGASGMGKSTLAAALCGLGHPLVSDDLLRVSGTVVHPGGVETRLRANAFPLAEPSSAYETADGRLASRPAAVVSEVLPLGACVIPRPSRDVAEVWTRRLRPAAALLRLASYPRVLGWSDGAVMAVMFQSLGDLVERVPVYEAAVPWGPPFQDDVLETLLAAVTQGLVGATS